MKPSKKFAFDIVITFISSIISMALGLVISVLVGRNLGAGELGLYSMTSTIYGISIVFAGIGIQTAVMKYVAEYKDDRNKSNKIVSSGIITTLLLGVVSSILFYLSSGMFEGIFKMKGLSGLLKILSPVFPFALVSGTLLGLLNGRREMKKYGVAAILQSILMIVISVPLFYQGFGVRGMVIGTVLSSAGSCLYLIRVSWSYFEITFESYVKTTKKLLKFGALVSGTNFIGSLNSQADLILTGYFLTATDLGYYGVAIGFSKFFLIIPMAIQRVTGPTTSEFWGKKDLSGLQIMVDKSMKYTACILLPIGLGVGFFATEIITKLYKEDFNYSVLPLSILIIGQMFQGIIISVGGSITQAGRPDLGMKQISISATINIVLNAVLIPYFGIVGAAIASLVTFLINSFIGLFLIIKVLKFKFDFEWFEKIFGITILSVLLFKYFEHINIYIIGITILLIYIIVILTLFITKDDRNYFIQLLH
jgi:stage V sporulation protein B